MNKNRLVEVFTDYPGETVSEIMESNEFELVTVSRNPDIDRKEFVVIKRSI